MTMPSDLELVLRARGGDQTAFELLLERHADIIGFACTRVYEIPGMDEDDVEQEARIGLFKAVCGYRPGMGSGFRNFATIAIQRHLYSALKTALRAKRRVLSDSRRFSETATASDSSLELGDVVPSREPSAFERILVREQLDDIVDFATTRLSDVERTVLARTLNGDSLEAAGCGLGRAASSAKTADNALQRIRRKLAAAA